MRRVVITGMGIVSSIGNNCSEVVASLRSGRSGIVLADEYRDLNFRSQVHGSIDIDLDQLIDRKLKRFMGDSAAYNYIAMREAVEAFRSAVKQGLLVAAVLLIPAFVFFWWFAERFGGRSKERKHERGAMLVSLDELEEEIERHNKAFRAEELGRKFGWKWRLAGSSAIGNSTVLASGEAMALITGAVYRSVT